jgi:N-acetylneuraminic acid mutarotase
MGQGDDLNDLWTFNEKAGWSIIKVESNMKPAPRSYHAGTSTGKYLFVFGGCSGHGRLNDLWRFDVQSAVWEQLHAGGDGADRPSVRGGAMLFAPSEKEVYVICGFAGKELGDAWKFDVDMGSWQQIPTGGMPARSVAACANVDGRAWIFGGERDPSADGHKGAGHMRDDVYVFDPKDASFTAVECDGVKPVARGWMEWAPINGNTLLLVGGLSEENKRLSDVYLFQLHQ